MSTYRFKIEVDFFADSDDETKTKEALEAVLKEGADMYHCHAKIIKTESLGLIHECAVCGDEASEKINGNYHCLGCM